MHFNPAKSDFKTFNAVKYKQDWGQLNLFVSTSTKDQQPEQT